MLIANCKCIPVLGFKLATINIRHYHKEWGSHTHTIWSLFVSDRANPIWFLKCWLKWWAETGCPSLSVCWLFTFQLDIMKSSQSERRSALQRRVSCLVYCIGLLS